MHAINFSAAIAMQEAQRTFFCGRTPVLTYSAEYPQAALPNSPAAQNCINAHICQNVRAFYGYVLGELFRQAAEGFREAARSGYPFNAYDAVQQYEITYNRNCHLSLSVDQYTYTGGAHGSTVRHADTWNLQTGCRLNLSDLFPQGEDWRAFVIAQLICLADAQMQQNPGIYFENYRELIRKHFSEQNFYLTPEGLAVFFQQYEIAPYATGIVVFTIPYSTLKWEPACREDAPLGMRP